MSGILSAYTRALDTPTVQRICTQLGAPRLAPHLPIVLGSTVLFFAVQELSSVVASKLFPEHWKRLSKKTKNDWGLHATGWVHALISTPLSLLMILRPSTELVRDPIFGYAPFEGSAIAFSGGYFLYDLFVSAYLLPTHGVPFLVHATACCYIFLKAFTPILNGFSGSFLVWELSTIFLHIHWWLDKLNMTGSAMQLINGGLLLATFFGARIGYGIFNTMKLWQTLRDPRVSPAMRIGFRAANLALCALNINWFRLMIDSVRKRAQVREAGDAGSGTPSEKTTRDLPNDKLNGKAE